MHHLIDVSHFVFGPADINILKLPEMTHASLEREFNGFLGENEKKFFLDLKLHSTLHAEKIENVYKLKSIPLQRT